MASVFEATAGKLIGPTVGTSVTQATNKSTGVTANTATGVITLNNAALAAAAEVSFTVTNSEVAATDVVVVNHASGDRRFLSGAGKLACRWIFQDHRGKRVCWFFV